MLADFTQRLPEDHRIRFAAALTPVLEGNLLRDVPPALAIEADPIEPGRSEETSRSATSDESQGT
jgi:hypothetical protein